MATPKRSFEGSAGQKGSGEGETPNRQQSGKRRRVHQGDAAAAAASRPVRRFPAGDSTGNVSQANSGTPQGGVGGGVFLDGCGGGGMNVGASGRTQTAAAVAAATEAANAASAHASPATNRLPVTSDTKAPGSGSGYSLGAALAAVLSKNVEAQKDASTLNCGLGGGGGGGSVFGGMKVGDGRGVDTNTPLVAAMKQPPTGSGSGHSEGAAFSLGRGGGAGGGGGDVGGMEFGGGLGVDMNTPPVAAMKQPHPGSEFHFPGVLANKTEDQDTKQAAFGAPSMETYSQPEDKKMGFSVATSASNKNHNGGIAALGIGGQASQGVSATKMTANDTSSGGPNQGGFWSSHRSTDADSWSTAMTTPGVAASENQAFSTGTGTPAPTQLGFMSKRTTKKPPLGPGPRSGGSAPPPIPIGSARALPRRQLLPHQSPEHQSPHHQVLYHPSPHHGPFPSPLPSTAATEMMTTVDGSLDWLSQPPSASRGSAGQPLPGYHSEGSATSFDTTASGNKKPRYSMSWSKRKAIKDGLKRGAHNITFADQQLRLKDVYELDPDEVYPKDIKRVSSGKLRYVIVTEDTEDEADDPEQHDIEATVDVVGRIGAEMFLKSRGGAMMPSKDDYGKFIKIELCRDFYIKSDDWAQTYLVANFGRMYSILGQEHQKKQQMSLQERAALETKNKVLQNEVQLRKEQMEEEKKEGRRREAAAERRMEEEKKEGRRRVEEEKKEKQQIQKTILEQHKLDREFQSQQTQKDREFQANQAQKNQEFQADQAQKNQEFQSKQQENMMAYLSAGNNANRVLGQQPPGFVSSPVVPPTSIPNNTTASSSPFLHSLGHQPPTAPLGNPFSPTTTTTTTTNGAQLAAAAAPAPAALVSSPVVPLTSTTNTTTASASSLFPHSLGHQPPVAHLANAFSPTTTTTNGTQLAAATAQAPANYASAPGASAAWGFAAAGNGVPPNSNAAAFAPAPAAGAHPLQPALQSSNNNLNFGLNSSVAGAASAAASSSGGPPDASVPMQMEE